MKRTLAVLLALVLLLGAVPALADDTVPAMADHHHHGDAEPAEDGEEAPGVAELVPVDAAGFIDIGQSDWFYPSVDRVCAAGIMAGTGDGCFNPDVITTRAMVVTVLYRLGGQALPVALDADTPLPFADVPADAWYAPAVTWAQTIDVSRGTSYTTFDPDGQITREEFFTMVYRYAVAYGYWDEGAPLPFADAGSIHDWAREGLEWLTAKGLLAGKPDGRIDPTGLVTRAETAVVLERMMTYIDGQVVYDF